LYYFDKSWNFVTQNLEMLEISSGQRFPSLMKHFLAILHIITLSLYCDF